MNSGTYQLLFALNAPAFLLSKEGNWLTANQKFNDDMQLEQCRQSLCDFIKPYLNEQHGNIVYVAAKNRIDLSMTPVTDGSTLVICKIVENSNIVHSIEQDHSYFAILDGAQRIICSSHPKVLVQQDAAKQFDSIFEASAAIQIRILLAQLPAKLFSETIVCHRGKEFIFAAEPLSLDERAIILITWQNAGMGFQPITGISQRYRYLLKAVNGLTDGLIISDSCSQVVLLNKRFHVLFPNTNEQQYIGWSIQAVAESVLAHEFDNNPLRAKRFLKWFNRKVENKQALRFSFKTSQGLYLEYRDRLTDQGERIGLLIDSTKTKELNLKLEQANLTMRQDSDAKSQFMAVMGHEIRTPLNAIIGLLELSLTDSNNKGNRNLSVAHRSANHLLALLNDVLEFTRFESSKVELSLQPTDIRQLCEDVLITFAAQAAQQNCWLDLYVAPDVAKIVLCDDVRLIQVLHNLISNALKFNVQTQPTALIVVEKVDSLDDSQTLKLSVIDNGIGISKSQQQRIFQGFMQASEETHRKYGGSGLGLSICQKICQLMGSKLEVDSDEGAGASLFFQVQFDCLDQGNPDNYQILNNPQLKFYCNNLTVTYSLKRYSQALGFKTEYVASENLMHIHDPNAVLLVDFNQEDIPNNHDFHERLKQMPQKKASLIGNQPQPHKSDMRRLRLMPLKLNQIANLITSPTENKLEEPQSSVVQPVPETQQDLWHIKLLIVEDNKDNIYLFQQQIKNLGLHAEYCLDPLDALALFKQQQFDVVITDYQMPELTGAELALAMREHENQLNRPYCQILVLTADRSDDCLQACDNAEVDRLLAKPLSLESLREILQQINMLFIQPLREQTEPSNQQEASHPSWLSKRPNIDINEPELSLNEQFADREDLFLDPFAEDDSSLFYSDDAESSIDDQPIPAGGGEFTIQLDPSDKKETIGSASHCINIEQIYEFTGEIDAQTLADLLEQFQNNLENRAESLTFAMQVGEYDNVSSIAHSIKGSALYIGANPLSEACQRLEQVAKSATNEQQIQSAWQKVELEFERVRIFFKSWNPKT